MGRCALPYMKAASFMADACDDDVSSQSHCCHELVCAKQHELLMQHMKARADLNQAWACPETLFQQN